ncbi:MAG: hypothetical protein AAGJ79_14310, partial [Verrucomicrobiota bacterium]
DEQCHCCGFDLESVKAKFPFTAQRLERFTDPQGRIHSATRRIANRAMDALCAEFPQVRPFVFFARLPPDIDVREFGFWLFNVSKPANRKEAERRAHGILFVYDWGSNAASLTVGYGLDPFVGDMELRRLIKEAAPAFVERQNGTGIAKVMGGFQALLREKHAAAVVLAERWEKAERTSSRADVAKKSTQKVRSREQGVVPVAGETGEPSRGNELELDLDLVLQERRAEVECDRPGPGGREMVSKNSVLVLFIAIAGLARVEGEVVVVSGSEGRPAGMVSGRFLPPKGSLGVSDPGNLLESETFRELASNLAQAKESGIEGFVVVLEEVPTLNATHLANEIIKRWTSLDSRVAFLILSYPRPGDRPLVMIIDTGGVPPENLQAMRMAAETAISGDISGSSGRAFLTDLSRLLVESAATSNTGLDELDAPPKTRVEMVPEETPGSTPPAAEKTIDPEAASVMNPSSKDSRGFSFLSTLIPVAAVGFGLTALVLLVRFLFRILRYRAKRFPEVEVHERLKAPYSGGNSARVIFAKPDTRTE